MTSKESPKRPFVFIEVSGGVAEARVIEGDVIVEILDWDNLGVNKYSSTSISKKRRDNWIEYLKELAKEYPDEKEYFRNLRFSILSMER